MTTLIDYGTDTHTGIILNTTGDLAVVFESPSQSADPLMPCSDRAMEWLDTFDVGDRLSALYVVSRNKRPPGKKKTVMRELRRGWERCYAEIKLLTPNVKRILLICQTEMVRLLFPGVPPMDEVHGTIFTLDCGLEVVPTFHEPLAHIRPWMDSDARRWRDLVKPASPLPYTVGKLPQAQHKMIVVDLETNYPLNTHVTLMGIQWSETERSLHYDNFDKCWAHLTQLLYSGTHIYFHNKQFDIKYATQAFRDAAVETLRTHCTLVRARSAGENPAGLKHLGNLYTDRPGNYAWAQQGNKDKSFDDPKYVCEDIHVTYKLAQKYSDFKPLVVQLFDQVVIMAAEQGEVGSTIAVDKLATVVDDARELAGRLYNELVAKYGVDPGKQDDLCPVLIKMGYPVKKNKATGKYILTAKELDKFGLYDIKLWRQTVKLDNSFVGKLQRMLRDDNTVKHSQNMLAAETGRSTMTNSIWQTAPRKGPVRGLLVSRYKGGSIWYIDLAQNEIRTGVYLSGDVKMGKWALLNDGHRVTASRAFNVPESEVTEEQRDGTAKPLLFRKMYMGKAYTEMQKIVERYLESEFGTFFQWADAVGNQCKHDLAVTDAWGKTRRLEEVLAYRGLEGVKRAGGNSPIQGLASHFALWLTLRVWKKMKRLKLKSLVLFGVHDAMVGDCYPGEEQQIVNCVQQAFKELGTFLVKQFELAAWLPLEGELIFGTSWGHCCDKKNTNTKYKCSTLEA